MSSREKTLADLQSHLDFLGIECAAQPDGNMLILDPLALLDHLTDEDFFAARPTATSEKSAAPPVPVHKTNNPVGALQEWTQARGPDARPPVSPSLVATNESRPRSIPTSRPVGTILGTRIRLP